MKRAIMLFVMFFVVLCLFGQANDRSVSMEDVMRLAREYATVMWQAETLHPAEPIPLYGPDDNVIAWEINFSILGAFPDLETLKTASDANFSISREAGFGDNDYAYVIIGANRDMPAIIQSAKSLSTNIAKAREIEREAAKYGDLRQTRIYYFGAAQVWTKMSDGKEVRYVNPFPYPRSIGIEEFAEIASEQMFWEEEDDSFDEEWDLLLTGINNMTRSSEWIPGEHLMPYYEWTYGCTPSAAAMMFAWWDHYRGASKLNAFHFTRHDPVVNQVKYHVSNTVRILADKMSTNSSGGTSPWNQADGMQEAAAVWNYTSTTGSWWSATYSSTYLYNRLKAAINAQIPALIGIGGHSVAAVGYWDETKQWFYHDSNYSSLQTLHRTNVKRVFWININIPSPAYFELVSPDGGKHWGTNLGGEVLSSGYPSEIRWEPHSHPNTHVEIWYHVEGGHPTPSTWEVITTNAPNNGTFNWMVPDINSSYGTTSDYCRVRIRLMDSSTNTLIAEDGSYGNFTITSSGDGMPYVQDYNQVNWDYATFAGLDYDPDAEWFVVGMRGQNDQWQVETYDDLSFHNLAHSSPYQVNANYIVINYNEITNPQAMGVKFRSQNNSVLRYNAAGHTPQIIQTNTLYNKVHPSDKAVDIYQVYLSAGTWYFDFGQTDLGFAIYRPEGNGFYAFHEARSWSRDSSGASGGRSFAYHATTAGWHALVVNSLHERNSNYKIEIKDMVNWTGAVSTDWFDAANWTSPIPPTQHYDVVIPASAVRQPTISGGTLATAKSLSIQQGATLTVSSGVLTVYEDLHVYGAMNLSSPGLRTQVNCNGTVNISPTGSLNAVNNSLFKCNGHWSSAPGASVIFIQTSELQVGSYHQSAFYNASADINVANMIISNYSGGSVTIYGPATGEINVMSTLQIHGGSKLFCESDQKLIANTVSNYGIFGMSRGTLRITGSGTVFPNNSGDYFHNLELNHSGTFTLDRNLTLSGSLSLMSGFLSPGSRMIYIGGNWSVLPGASFIKGTSQVIFNGSQPQICNGSSFYILKVQNNVHFSGSVFIDKYQWVSGAMHQDGGNVIIYDLIHTSIMGKYVINN